MRRFLLVLTIISFAGWSQPAQQQAQPPITVTTEMPPTPHRDFLGYLQGLGPLIAASVAFGVALVQYCLQRQQMKQQLFDKCFEIYLCVRRFLSLALDLHNNRQTLDDQNYTAFLMHTRPAKFLFGSDVQEYLREIRKHIAHEEDNDGNVIKRVGWEDDDPFALIMKWGWRAEQVFRPYLQLHHELNWLQRSVSCADRWMDTADKVMASRYKE